MKLNFGKRLLMDGLPLDEEGPGDAVTLSSIESGVRRKFTLLGVGIGVESIFISTTS